MAVGDGRAGWGVHLSPSGLDAVVPGVFEEVTGFPRAVPSPCTATVHVSPVLKTESLHLEAICCPEHGKNQKMVPPTLRLQPPKGVRDGNRAGSLPPVVP